MDLKQLRSLKNKLESSKKYAKLTEVEEQLLAELRYLEEIGVMNDKISLSESVSVAKNECKYCRRPY